MPDIWAIAAPQLLTYFLIMLRLGSLFLMTPFFGSAIFPAKVKVFLGLILAFVVFPHVEMVTGMPEHPIAFALLASQEVLIGLVIGFSCQLVFHGFQLAGSFIGHQMMFRMVNVLDPESNIQISIMGQVEFLVAILLFLVLNGHHWLLKAMVDSFDVIPLGKVSWAVVPMLREFDRLFGQMFIIALQVSAPAAGTLFLTRLSLGFVARVMPQMNVFIVGMPLYVGVGLITTGMSLGLAYVIFEKYLIGMVAEVYTLLRLMA